MSPVSRAPLQKLEARKARMRWTFPWVSSGDGDFNTDFEGSFRDADLAAGTARYNFAPKQGAAKDLPGVSALVRDGDAIFHACSCFARGLDGLNPAYALLDLTPLGRREEGLPFPMSGVRLPDEYSA